jgi:putative membrane protein
MKTSIACLTALALIVACSKRDNYATDSAAGGVGATTTPAAAPPPAPPPSTTMTDANIVAKLSMADSAEVKLARLAETKAKAAPVKAYARELATDHSNHLKELAALEKKASLNPAAPSNDNSKQEADQTYSNFQSMAKGLAFDTAFVNHMVADHEKVLSDVKALSPQNADLKALIDKTVPTLQKHLDKAKDLQGKLK